ncbi:lysophospholipid acyltransferase 1-like isoform X2 [Belonocnema kinseyi]|uniref:lysophospholipid acyltransferase 1-like isoform X2 n=1 Tax=Belonocnema kinseyi TaxID=2817044 RepID=UPI00143DF83A|nr:lysophospholipid acyltransferase 1-like isoform X2 [Belonocnema kinseyi]
MTSINNNAYDGFRTFSWLEDLSGVPLDKINFIIVYMISFAIAGLLRSSLSAEKVKPETRHAFCIIFGLILGYFAFGKYAMHLIGFSTICYGVITTRDPKLIHIEVFIVAALYLSYLHLHLQILNYGTYTLDIRGPIMIMTGKVTSLACSLHDGFARPEKELTVMQKEHVIRKRPSLLEYYSYLLSFLTIMAGPGTFYDEYMDFIHNRRIQEEKLQNKNFSERELQFSINLATLKKVCLGTVFLVLLYVFLHTYDIQNMTDDEFLKNTSMFYKIWCLNILASIHRLNYYFAWVFVDAICNNAGFGFNGFDENGQIQWTLVTNVNVWEIEVKNIEACN